MRPFFPFGETKKETYSRPDVWLKRERERMRHGGEQARVEGRFMVFRKAFREGLKVVMLEHRPSLFWQTPSILPHAHPDLFMVIPNSSLQRLNRCSPMCRYRSKVNRGSPFVSPPYSYSFVAVALPNEQWTTSFTSQLCTDPSSSWMHVRSIACQSVNALE